MKKGGIVAGKSAIASVRLVLSSTRQNGDAVVIGMGAG